MSWIEALILGLLQGFTEFLPVSSSGHLELGSALFGLEEGDNLTFSILVHAATVLSIIVVFRKDIINLIINVFKFQWNDETRFVLLIAASAVPVAVVGLLFEDRISELYTGNVVFVGFMLLITATLLFLTRFVKKTDKEVNLFRALIIGIAQTVAVLPGISRSGATITTALFLGVDKVKATRFSFLMVLVPILGASFLEVLKISSVEADANAMGLLPLGIGFAAAFISGLIACSWMIEIVRKGNLMYFSVYCLIAGLIAIMVGIS
jgi:undecaprenyl-diphosphatase